MLTGACSPAGARSAGQDAIAEASDAQEAKIARFSASLPQKYRGGAFVGEHGSWDRPRFNGYKVVFVPFSGGRPSGKAEDVVTGFLNSDEKARGRPGGAGLRQVRCPADCR